LRIKLLETTEISLTTYRFAVRRRSIGNWAAPYPLLD